MSPPGDYGDFELVRGCSKVRQVESGKPGFILLNCDSDGEDGIVFLNAESLSVEIYFYMPQLGYPEHTSLQLRCRALYRDFVPFIQKYRNRASG